MRFLVNKRNIKLLQKAEELKILKKKLKEYIGKLQKTVKELEKRNYYLRRESRILRELIRNYQNQNKVLKGFVLIVFILE